MPENIRTVPIKFAKLADYITEEYSQAHHSDSRNVKQRIEKLKEHFGVRAAESIKPAEIDNWLSKNTRDLLRAPDGGQSISPETFAVPLHPYRA